MVTINKDSFDETRIKKAGDDSTQWLPNDLLEELKATETTEATEPAQQEIIGATQRVYIDTNQTNTASRDTATNQAELRAGVKARSAERRAAALREKKRKQRITLIAICAAAAMVLLGVVILLISLFRSAASDDGRIHNNVYAAGVDLSGLTPEQAKKKLERETGDTYTQLDMTITLLDQIITLSPADTGAKLDLDAVVEAAQKCGREGETASSYTVSIVPYLNLDTDYIHGIVDELGERYATTLSQTTYTVEGEKPNMKQDEYDTSVTHQTLTIQIGNAEYGLNTNTLYQQIIDAYEINLFEVSCQCTVLAPEPMDYEAVYNELCTAPIDAVLDTSTYEVTPEVYGYGFTLDELKAAVEGADYGSVVTVPMRFIEPNITADFYSGEMFQDTLASYATSIPSVDGWKENLELVCEAINGKVLKSGEEFSFNGVVGEPTTDKGYKTIRMFLGRAQQDVVGGGISQAASTLYYCALMSDLPILERNNHGYAVDFIQNGFDAEVSYGLMDMRFQNNTEYPIRIDAVVEQNKLKITIIGTDTKDYYVRLNYEVDETHKPHTVFSTMLQENAGGYKNGDVLTSGITGYTISTYILKYNLSNNRLISETKIAESYYAKRDQVVVKIYAPPVVDPNPTDPSGSTDPSGTVDPSESTDPSTSTDPSESTDPSTGTEDPTESTGPVDSGSQTGENP